MIKAYWYRDIHTIVNSPRRVFWNLIGIAVLILLMRISESGSSSMIFGSDFVRLVLLSLIGIISFMDVYSEAYS